MTDFLTTQFVVYTVCWKSPASGKVYPASLVYQTFEEALEYCCKTSCTKEILSIENDDECFKKVIHIRFNDSADEYYITPSLFTYHKDNPLIELKDIRDDKHLEYRKLGD